MDVKALAEQLIAKLQKDPALLKEFQTEPVKTVEKLAGISLPAGSADQIVKLVKTKLTADQAADALGALKKLF